MVTSLSEMLANDPPWLTREERIRELAYLKWEAAGSPNSDGIEFWLQAEREISALQLKGYDKERRKVAAKITALRK